MVANNLLILGAIVVLLLLFDVYYQKEPTLYERLGGVYSIAAVVNHFSDALIKNPVVGVDSKNPQLRNWHRNQLDRLPGLKFMRTLWVCDVTGGLFKFHGSTKQQHRNPLNLGKAHCPFRISSDEFDAVAAELKRSLDHFKVPEREQSEVLGAFAKHKPHIIACHQ